MAERLAKPGIRKRGLKLRVELPATKRSRFNKLITNYCQDALDWNSYKRIHVFLPLERHGEVDTWPLIRWIWERHPGVEVYVPRITGKGAMEEVMMRPDSELRDNHLGIAEPVGGTRLSRYGRLDLVLVPLLGFDHYGHRVGYGGGYYDRFLASKPTARRVGLAYELSRLEDHIAIEDHDVPLEMVVTEKGVHRFIG